MVHVVVMMMVVVMVMMMMMMHLSGGGRRRGGRSSFLSDCVAGEAEREHGGGGEGLDHDNDYPVFEGTSAGHRLHTACWLNST